MKKLTISIALVAGILSAKAQDTTCTYLSNEKVLEFNYYTSEVLHQSVNKNKYYDINVKYGDVLCLDFYDKKNVSRKVTLTFFDGETVTEILKSKDNYYYTPKGVTKVTVGKPKSFFFGKK
jgi:hypothetical protein|tara:strand:- start:98 stop:460 length:363 start_codon:yes stop_codon:yes gene_type:complete